jgi:hypothetical protein
MMKPYPELQTDRLILREVAAEDATSVQRLAGEWEVACIMLFVTHSYEDREWPRSGSPPATLAYESGEHVTRPLSVVNDR